MPKNNVWEKLVGRQQSIVEDASLEGQSGLGYDGPATSEDAASTASQNTDLYSTKGETGIRVITNPDEAILEYEQSVCSCCDCCI